MKREPRFVAVGAAASLPSGEMREYVVEDVEIVVVNLDGQLHALANQCPHQGGPLGRGRLDEDGVIWCPWHLWQFDARNGRARWPEGYGRVMCFPVKVEDGQILVAVG
ncbi:MAG: Rieske (2Fe-2S) protein [Chloroflexota bacterium]